MVTSKRIFDVVNYLSSLDKLDAEAILLLNFRSRNISDSVFEDYITSYENREKHLQADAVQNSSHIKLAIAACIIEKSSLNTALFSSA